MILFYIILAFLIIWSTSPFRVQNFQQYFILGDLKKNKYFILREIHKLKLFTKNGNYMTINHRKIQNPDHFPICKFQSKIQGEGIGREIKNVCSKIFPLTGGQNMIFVATVKESVSTRPATQQHTHQSESKAAARWGGLDLSLVWTPGKNMKIDDLT